MNLKHILATLLLTVACAKMTFASDISEKIYAPGIDEINAVIKGKKHIEPTFGEYICLGDPYKTGQRYFGSFSVGAYNFELRTYHLPEGEGIKDLGKVTLFCDSQDQSGIFSCYYYSKKDISGAYVVSACVNLTLPGTNWELVSGPVEQKVVQLKECWQSLVNTNDVKQCYVRPTKPEGK